MHCYGGVGRSGLTAITLLIKNGFDLEEAIELASEKRKYPVPQTEQQVKMLEYINDSLEKEKRG